MKLAHSSPSEARRDYLAAWHADHVHTCGQCADHGEPDLCELGNGIIGCYRHNKAILAKRGRR